MQAADSIGQRGQCKSGQIRVPTPDKAGVGPSPSSAAVYASHPHRHRGSGYVSGGLSPTAWHAASPGPSDGAAASLGGLANAACLKLK